VFPNQWELNHSFLSSWAKSPSSMIAGDFRGKSMRDHQPQVSVSRTKLKWTGGGTSKPGEGATAPVVFAHASSVLAVAPALVALSWRACVSLSFVSREKKKVITCRLYSSSLTSFSFRTNPLLTAYIPCHTCHAYAAMQEPC